MTPQEHTPEMLAEDLVLFRLQDLPYLRVGNVGSRLHRNTHYDYVVYCEFSKQYWIKDEILFCILRLSKPGRGWLIAALSVEDDHTFEDQGPFLSLHDAIEAANAYSDESVNADE